jgi:hypothetical protein
VCEIPPGQWDLASKFHKAVWGQRETVEMKAGENGKDSRKLGQEWRTHYEFAERDFV